MGRAVLLRHEVQGGGGHFDWMIERGAGGPLVTFRVGERIDRVGAGGFQAERIGEHRREYLEFEGELTGGRGRVRRVATGELEIEIDGDGRFVARGRLGEREGCFEGVAGTGGKWGFRFLAGS